MVTKKRLVRALLIAAILVAVAAPEDLAGRDGAALELGFGRCDSDADSGDATARRAHPRHGRSRRAEPLAETVTSTGTLLAAESVDLQAEVNGKITAINFVEGAPVREGDLLVKLNDADLQARRVAAAYEVSLAELREQRIAELLAKGFVIPDDHDEALNEVNVRRAEIALMEAADRENRDSRAVRRHCRAALRQRRRVRERRRRGSRRYSASTRSRSISRCPEKYADRIRLDSPIAFTVAGRPQRFAGTVYAYDPRIDSETRTLLIRALCPNPGEVLLPGAFANVELTLGETEDALLVPAEALIPDFKTAFVFVVRDGKAERREVVTGVRTDSRVQIVAGLEPGEMVVTSGLPQLRHGSAVTVELGLPTAAVAHR